MIISREVFINVSVFNVCVCALYAVNISGQSLMMYWSVNFYLVVNEYHIDTTQPDSIQVLAFFLFLFLLFEGGGHCGDVGSVCLIVVAPGCMVLSL